MESPIFFNVCPRDQDNAVHLMGSFAPQVGQDFLIAEIGCLLNHKLFREEEGVLYSKYEEPDALVFVFYFESVL